MLSLPVKRMESALDPWNMIKVIKHNHKCQLQCLTVKWDYKWNWVNILLNTVLHPSQLEAFFVMFVHAWNIWHYWHQVPGKNILSKYYITGVYIFSIYGGEINNFRRSWDKMKTLQGLLSCFSCILLKNLFYLPYFENKDFRKRT